MNADTNQLKICILVTNLLVFLHFQVQSNFFFNLHAGKSYDNF